jgi:membrane protease YdiL (CAAX protease family)
MSTGWRYSAWLVLCAFVVLAAKDFATLSNDALWQAFRDQFERWRLAGLPYYAIWALILLVWTVGRGATPPRWTPPAGCWTRRNVAFLAALVVATEAVYGFKMVAIVGGSRTPFDQVSSAGYALSAAFAAPAIEELLFRGFLWQELNDRAPTERLGLVAAVAVSSLLFALWHLPFTFGPYREPFPPLPAHFLFGVLMALARWRLGSIGVGAVIHGLWNVL